MLDINIFKQLADLNYIVIPIVPYDREFVAKDKMKPGGKAPGRFEPSTNLWYGLPGWQRYLDNPPTARTLARWCSHTTSGLPNIGVLTGGLICAVDLDLTHPELAKAAFTLAVKILGVTPFVRIGAAPKSLLVFRLTGDEPLIKMKSVAYELDGYKNQAVEILGRGQQFVAFGTHPGTKKPYTWPEKSLLDTNANDLPSTTPGKLREFLREFEFLAEVYGATAQNLSTLNDTDHISSDLADGRGLVASAVASLPASLSDDYHSWVRTGLAIKAALPDDEGLARELWDEFSAKSEKYEPSVANEKFDSFHATRIGAGTLYQLAAEHGDWQPPETILAAAEDDFTAVDAQDLPSGKPSPLARNLYYKKPGDIKLSFNSTALIEDFIDQRSFSMMYGDTNVGKSFTALDMAMHIATGKEWHGKKVMQGVVLYVAAEGGRSAENRISALKQHYNLVDFPLLLVPCPIDLLNPGADTKPLIKLIQQASKAEGHPVRFIVIDTLSRAMAGGNENDSKDMGVMVQHLDIIREASQAHVMVVHHSGKDKARGARGHSLLRAATDTEIEVAHRQISVTKQRDMPICPPIYFNLKTIELGTTPNGKKITSCVVERLERSGFDNDFTLEPRDALIYNAFLDIVATLPQGTPVKQVAWGRVCKDFDLNRVPGCPPWPHNEKSFQTAFKRSRERLSQLGYISAVGGATRGGHWLPTLGDSVVSPGVA